MALNIHHFEFLPVCAPNGGTCGGGFYYHASCLRGRQSVREPSSSAE
jgi:hypothetical protein